MTAFPAVGPLQAIALSQVSSRKTISVEVQYTMQTTVSARLPDAGKSPPSLFAAHRKPWQARIISDLASGARARRLDACRVALHRHA